MLYGVRSNAVLYETFFRTTFLPELGFVVVVVVFVVVVAFLVVVVFFVVVVVVVVVVGLVVARVVVVVAVVVTGAAAFPTAENWSVEASRSTMPPTALSHRAYQFTSRDRVHVPERAGLCRSAYSSKHHPTAAAPSHRRIRRWTGSPVLPRGTYRTVRPDKHSSYP